MVKNIYKKGTSHKEIEHYDVLILGGGPAGITAAIYSARYHLSTAVVAKSIGGTANLAGEIENWPGYIGSGAELMKKFRQQAEKFGARFLEAEVNNIKKDDNGYVLEIEDKEIHTKSLILALGTENRKLNVPGEKEFLGKGVSYCATCDGNFFKGKTVAVVGGANAAAKAALFLSEITEKVHIIYRRQTMRCEPISLKKIKTKKNIEIHYRSNPTQITGDNTVKAMEIEKEIEDEENNTEKIEKIKLDVDGVFIEIGATPVAEIMQALSLKMDEKGYIITDKNAKTNISGVFAAGDNTNNSFKQVVTAAGEGAIAAKSAHDFVRLAN